MDTIFANVGQWFWSVLSNTYAMFASCSVSELIGLLALLWIIAIIFRVFARGAGSAMRMISSVLVAAATLLSIMVVIGIVAKVSSGAVNDVTAFTGK